MVDKLTRKIINVLNKNARLSFREIARETKTSVTAVIRRIKKLEEDGAIIGYVPLINPRYFGFDLIAIIALRISKGKLIETQEIIARYPRVMAVYDITGEWDSIVIGYFQNREELNSMIKKVLALPYVERTVTHIVLNVVKEERRFWLDE
ncbi:MAG: Lrp/AsnC family transcriptional regulator [Candidatus Aminicenantes bacterium]|nr:Lrp/AsnC family transcriptional regulator [Candidatus Aminicenantes bacterium]